MLKEKLIVITGGKAGLGFAVAQKMVEDNATVVITSREIKFNPDEITLHTINRQYLDVNSEESIDRFFLWFDQRYCI